MKRTFNKQIIGGYIQYQYIERTILAIKRAKKKKSKLRMKKIIIKHCKKFRESFPKPTFFPEKGQIPER